MKKLCIGLLLFGWSSATHAQGTVDFSNRKGLGINAPVFDTDGATKLGDRFLGQLYAGTNASTLGPVGVPVAFRNLPGTTNGSGYIVAGLLTLPGTITGPAAWLQFRAWESNGGSSYEAALAARKNTGKSAVFQITPGGGLTPPAPLIGLQGFSLVAANQPPVSSGFGATTPQNQLLQIPVSSLLGPVHDPEGGVVSLISVASFSTNGAAVAANASAVYYFPNSGFVGADRFSYVVSDPLGATNTVFAQIAVLPPGMVVNAIQSPSVTAGSVSFNFTGLPGRTYQVQRSSSATGPWQNVGSITIQPDGTGVFMDNSPLAGGGFYRTVLPP